MVIDDEPDVAQLVAKRIRVMGFDTMCLYHGREAVQTIVDNQPDLILLDIWLPDISGIEIFGQLRTDEKTQHIPVVFFSADPSKEDYCLNTLGADGFLKKPYDPAGLSSTIQRLLNHKAV